MFNKIVICILFLLINSTLELVPTKLEQYGSITVSTQTLLYLSLDGFKSGDTLYFEGSFTNDVLFNDIPLYFLETDELVYNSKTNLEMVLSNSYSQMGAHITYYISYTLKGNHKYLFIGTPDFSPYIINLKVEHTKRNNIIWIIIAVVAVIVIAIIIIVVCRLRRRSAMM